MKKPICIITEPDWLPKGIAEKLKPHFELVYGPFTDEGLAEAAKEAVGYFIGLDHVLKGDLLPPSLKFIACPTTGLNHIDLDQAAKQNIVIHSLKGETEFLQGITATSELCWGLILSLSRKIVSSVNSVEQDEWDRDRFISNELQDKTIGIIGLGRLGKKIATYAKAFEMKVLACDPVRIEMDGVEWVEQEELCRRADIISLHTDSKPENTKMIGAKQFSQMKQEALFINTARGDLIDEAALLTALKEGSIAGAALDVLTKEVEEFPDSDALINYAKDHENLIITPHIGGVTYESQSKTAHFVVDKMLKWWEA